MEKLYRVILTPAAKKSLRGIIEFIKKDSPTAAVKVRKRLIRLARSLDRLPERFSTEPYLVEKMGNYRSVTLWHYKIVYRVLDDKS